MSTFFRKIHTQELSYFGVALIIGILGGIVGTAFHVSLEAIIERYSDFVFSFNSLFVSVAVAMALSAFMVLVAAWLVRRFAPEAGGSGIQEIEGVMAGLK